jgi:O-antigen chain-terminating methyltransferase
MRVLTFPYRLVELFARVKRLERQVLARPYVNPQFTRARHRPGDESFDYAEFENKFRGPDGLIRDHLGYFVPHLEACRKVIDLGCGRGELLEVLREAGIPAVGVEANADQAAAARAKSLEIVEADLFEHLQSLPDESLDAIVSAQVIEHIPFDRMVALFHLSHRKLREGGVFIAETVNPHCTAAFKFFYMDATHVTVIYPEVAQFVAETAGFAHVEIIYPVAGDPTGLYHDCGEYAVKAYA